MDTKLKCLLLDDELPGLTYLKMLCEQVEGLEVVKAFNSPEAFLREINRLDFDLCILDIEMPGMDGLHVANLLGGKPVIFTTAYRQHAAEAFELDAVDYLCKPLKKERLQQAVQKAAKRIELSPAKGFMQLNTDKGKAVLFFDQVNYIKTSDSDSRDKLASMSDGTLVLLKNIPFERLLQLLPADQFCRVNKQEVIALRCVRFFSHDELLTTLLQPNGKPLRLAIGEAFAADFLRKVKR